MIMRFIIMWSHYQILQSSSVRQSTKYMHCSSLNSYHWQFWNMGTEVLQYPGPVHKCPPPPNQQKVCVLEHPLPPITVLPMLCLQNVCECVYVQPCVYALYYHNKHLNFFFIMSSGHACNACNARTARSRITISPASERWQWIQWLMKYDLPKPAYEL
jgi:hypothetical protein